MRVRAREWFDSARTPRMLALLVVLALAAYVCGRLGAWQLDRASLRGAAEAEQIQAEREDAAPLPLGDVLRVGETFTTDDQARKIEAIGQWGESVLVPGRQIDGAAAVLVVTALWLSEGPDAGAMLPVVRGWVPNTGDLGAPPAAPGGEVTVVAYLSGSEQARVVDGAGAVGAVSTAELAGLWGGPTFTGFAVSTTAGQGLAVVPPPTYAREEGMNLQSLAYAFEWWIFGGFALLVWWRLVREDAARRREEAILAAS